MHGQETREENLEDTSPISTKLGLTFKDCLMPKEDNGVNSLLVIGAGGLGCRWARAAHSRVSSESDLMLVDADMESSKGASNAHCMHLDPTGMEKGIAALPVLLLTGPFQHWMR